MLDIHEFSGNITYETNLGLETVDFQYNLMVGPDGDDKILHLAGKALAQFIVFEYLQGPHSSSVYHKN